jgi:group II intron reverse transcriptase/maturase
MNNVAKEQAHLAKLAATQPHKRFRKLYRLMANRLWLEAAREAIRTNKGFNTPGVDGLKGSDLDTERLERLADKLRQGTYEPKPVRRTFIPKRNGKLRPLGLPSAEDKVVQSAIKLVLEPIYEQVFRDCSHGFRPRRSCHTALRAYALRRTPTWTVEGDIESCFDNLSHGLILRLLREKIADERLIELVRKFLKAGYLQDWQWHATWSGSPQGHVLSPLLANVVLHELDQYVEKVLGANQPKDMGYARRNPAYNRLNLQVNRRSRRLVQETDPQKRAHLLKELQQLKEQRACTPSMRTERSMTYVRYCDDWVLALHGYSKDETKTIVQQLAQWLQTHLHLTLNPEKTLITHWTDRVRFLGFELRGVKSASNGVPQVPRLLIPHDAERRIRHEVVHLTRQTSIEPGDMITAVNLVLRGWMHYYAYATNPHRVFARVLHHAFWCLTRYLNKRHKCHGAKKVMQRYYGTVNGQKTLIFTSPATGRQVSLVRSIGRKSLYHLQGSDGVRDRREVPWMVYSAQAGRSPWQRAEVRALQHHRCAQCGQPLVEVHHRTALRRKTNPTQAGYQTTKIGLCHACHQVRTQQQRRAG